MIAVGDRISISINGAVRKAVVLHRFETSSAGKGGFVLGLNSRYRSGLFASWSPVKRGRHDLIVACFQYSVDPDEPLCYTWFDGDSSISLLQKSSSEADTDRRIPVVSRQEIHCKNRTCKKPNDFGARVCWFCQAPL